MPGRKQKPPRLWQRADGAWIILDGKHYQRTGCAGSDAGTLSRATQKLGDYIGARHKPAFGERDPARLPIADVLAAYERAKAPPQGERERARRHGELIARLEQLNEFFGDKMVASLNAQSCRDYQAARSGHAAAPRRPAGPASVRRELEDLRAAINHYHRDFGLEVVPRLTLPARNSPRVRWLTRSEAARLLAAALGFQWDLKRAAFARDARGRLKRHPKALRVRRAHVARFILLGLYSGRREATIRRTQWRESSAAPWLDLERWIYHGRGADEQLTKKRRPPAAIAFRLRPHLLRWRRLDQALEQRRGVIVLNVIHKTTGAPLADKIKTAWSGVLADAGLGSEVVRHILKHTAATWLMQAGVESWAAAGFLGITVEQLEATYGHQHPNFQGAAAAAFGGRRN